MLCVKTFDDGTFIRNAAAILDYLMSSAGHEHACEGKDRRNIQKGQKDKRKNRKKYIDRSSKTNQSERDTNITRVR